MEIKNAKQSGAASRTWSHSIMHLADCCSRQSVAGMVRLARFWRPKCIIAGFSTHGSRSSTLAVETARVYSIPVISGKTVGQAVGWLTTGRKTRFRLSQRMTPIEPLGSSPVKQRHQAGHRTVNGGPAAPAHGSLIDLPQDSSVHTWSGKRSRAQAHKYTRSARSSHEGLPLDPAEQKEDSLTHVETEVSPS